MDQRKFLKLNDINAYKVSFNLSNNIWRIVIRWNFFSKDTIGKQFTRAIDSISANIAEGFGRYGKKDKIKFYRYARGSVYESLDWLEKSKIRGLVKIDQYNHIFKVIESLPQEINHFISYTNLKLKI